MRTFRKLEQRQTVREYLSAPPTSQGYNEAFLAVCGCCGALWVAHTTDTGGLPYALECPEGGKEHNGCEWAGTQIYSEDFDKPFSWLANRGVPDAPDWNALAVWPFDDDWEKPVGDFPVHGSEFEEAEEGKQGE